MSALHVRVVGLRASGYKVLRDVDLSLRDGLTVLVGPNAVGKSTILDALGFVAEIARSGVAAALQRRSGLGAVRSRGTRGPVRVEVLFDEGIVGDLRRGGYQIALDEVAGTTMVEAELLWTTGRDGVPIEIINGRRAVADVLDAHQGHRESYHAAGETMLWTVADETAFPQPVHIRYALSSVELVDPTRHPVVTPAFLPEPERDPISRWVTDDDAAVRLGAYLAELVPGVVGVERVPSGDLLEVNLAVIEEGAERPTPIADLSGGTRQMLRLAALHVAPHPPKLILLEEPEAALHPGIQPALRDLLRSLAVRSVVVATSHSPSFISLLDPDREVLAVEKAEERVVVKPLAEAMRSRAWLDAFGTPAEAFARVTSRRGPR